MSTQQYKDDSATNHKTNGHGGRYNNPYVQITTPTSASGKRSKDKVLDVFNRCGKKAENVTRKAEALAFGLKDHLKFSPSISDAAMARLTQGTKMIVEGGPGRVFRREFGVLAAEKLLDSFVCYISTTSGPVTGMLYVSNRRIAFCSDYAIRLPLSAGGNGVVPAYYKVVMELEKISSISSSSNVLKPSERYVHMVTRDGFEFWFMGFVSYIDAFNCLNKAHLNSHTNHVL
ncbi:PREDICTED: GEM-like protein 2 isoform X1 [Camelina sativa]|uniref:GEM-like protein 2 isoform X1 n=1 Tax=Camelina sativa TaxID=90675 RepID=A0ABM0VHB5_CAMSA|nr:PREDICTED: GEM-like protein 2 isoform X1 [Camelina sativa]